MGSSETQRRTALPHSARLYKLLGQVARYYGRRFAEEPRAREYLTDRGLMNTALLKVFAPGYCDGTLHDVLPFDDQVHDDLRTLGLVKGNGKELFRECVVYPLWSFSGLCVGMYGRRLFDSEVPHLYLPGDRRGLINWQAAKRGEELVLCESVLDAMSAYAAGLHGAVPCYGTGGFTADHADMLKRFRPRSLAVCFDGDEAGVRGAAMVLEKISQLKGARPAVRRITLPSGMDLNGLFIEGGVSAVRAALLPSPAAVEAPLSAPKPPSAPQSPRPVGAQTIPPSKKSSPAPAPASPSPASQEPSRPSSPAASDRPFVEELTHGFALHIASRRYEVKAIGRQGTQLRVTVKAQKPDDERFELTTLDLYAHRSRQWFANLCAQLFGIETAQAERDLVTLMEHVEATLDGRDTKPSRIEMTDPERAEAEQMLGRPDLMSKILEDYEMAGYAGEQVNKQLGYLVAVSRKLDKPLSLLIESRSGAGKSALQDAILAFVPEEECLRYSRITDQALFYKAQDGLTGKLLVIEEAAGMGGSAYSIRALQSGEELRVAATGKDPATGKLKTEEYCVKARTAVMMTTTNPDFDEETKSRFIRASVDETSEMTSRILDVQRMADTVEGIALARRAERIRAVHHNAQRLLESVTVANPYAPKLTYPTHSLQARRDHKKYLTLIKAVTLLHQRQREVKTQTLYGEELTYIESTLEDIALANRIAQTVLVTSDNDVSPQAKRLLQLVRKMLLNGGGHTPEELARSEASFTRRRIRESTRWSDWQVRTHLQELVELEYIRVQAGRTGKEYVYALGDTQLLDSVPGFGLTDPEALADALNDRPARTARRRSRNPSPNLAVNP